MKPYPRVVPWLSSFLLAAASLTCSSDGGITNPPPPAALTMVSGDGQNGAINQPLAQPLVVRVDDAQGHPLEGATVTWTIEGGGSVSDATVRTGNDGLASVERTLGETAGEISTVAAVSGLTPVVFSSTVDAGQSPKLILATQPSETATSGVPLLRQPLVRAVDQDGEPLATKVMISASVDGATLSGTTHVQSDNYGEAQFSDLVLTGSDGSYNLTFSATGLVAVRSGAIALGATNGQTRRLVITTQPSNAAQSGIPLNQQPVVRVETLAGQPLGDGIEVTAAVTGATLGGSTTVETNASGEAHFTNLALTGSSGTYSLTFTASEASDVESNGIVITTVSAEAGQWSAPFDWPIVAVHMVLLPDGRVLSIGRVGVPQVWDPATGVFTAKPSPAWLFCAGHALLSDGRVLVAGGHISDGKGLPNITIFSPTSDSWSSDAPMARGRWYPTTTVLGNGDVVITAGTDQDSLVVTTPEVWSNGSLRQLPGADRSLPWYPRAFLAPDGTVFAAGSPAQTRFLSVVGNGSWTPGPTHLFGSRNYGSAVMYDSAKILVAGGDFTTNTAEVIDLDDPNPEWHWTASMAFARRHLVLTVLPTGEVLATGGVAGTGFNDISTGVHAAELWNPQSGQWATLASNAITRGYHQTTLLLPDGRVLNAGSGNGAGAPDQLNAEFFTPPYLLRGARPVITSAPSEIQYGEQFRIETPNASAITHVSFIRLGAVTHAFDENQRFTRLSFTADQTGLSVTAPTSPNRAPPGHYMVFILNGADVPSIAKIVRIH